MTPEQLEKAHKLLGKYRHLQGIKTDLVASTGFRLQLRLEFPANKEASYQHAPDIPVSAYDVVNLLDMLLEDTRAPLAELGVEV